MYIIATEKQAGRTAYLAKGWRFVPDRRDAWRFRTHERAIAMLSELKSRFL